MTQRRRILQEESLRRGMSSDTKEDTEGHEQAMYDAQKASQSSQYRPETKTIVDELGHICEDILEYEWYPKQPVASAAKKSFEEQQSYTDDETGHILSAGTSTNREAGDSFDSGFVRLCRDEEL